MGDVLGRVGAANLGRLVEARKSYEHALELSRDLLVRYPADDLVREQNASVILRISGIAKAQGDARVSLDLETEAIRNLGDAQTLDRLRLLADAYHELGGTYSQLGEWGKVVEVRQKALRVNANILKHRDATYDDRLRYVLARTRLASVLSRQKHYAEAAVEYEATLAEARAMLAQNPHSNGASDNLSNALLFAGISAQVQGKFDIAAQRFAEAYRIRSQRVAAEPNDWRMRSLAATSLLRWGMAEVSAGRRASGAAKLRASLRERTALAALDPDNTGALAEKGEAHAELSIALARSEEGQAHWKKAHEILDPLRAANKLNPILLEGLARADRAR
jgi:tetratricopeptide (TPR) repeat protein